MKWFLLTGLLFLFIAPAFAQDLSVYEKHWFQAAEGRLPYRILYPIAFDSSQQYPVIAFLHGAGHRGNDNESQLQVGGRFFLRNREQFPAIILFPQCPANDVWRNLTMKSIPLQA